MAVGMVARTSVMAWNFMFLFLHRAWTYLPFFTVAVKRVIAPARSGGICDVELLAVALRAVLDLADQDRRVVDRVRARVQEDLVLLLAVERGHDDGDAERRARRRAGRR